MFIDENRRNFDRKIKRPVQKDGPEIADGLAG
jgi:hypothetical protein